MPFQYKKHLNYEDNVLLFLINMPSGGKIELSSLTDKPYTFIEAVKNLINEGWVRNGEFYFSNNYRFIQRDSYRKWFSNKRK